MEALGPSSHYICPLERPPATYFVLVLRLDVLTMAPTSLGRLVLCHKLEVLTLLTNKQLA